MRLGLVFVAASALTLSGCSDPQTITLDFSSNPLRLIIDHRGWPRPFMCPRVTQFALASNEDGAVWELESDDARGVPARQLALIYGQVPPGFHQITPSGSVKAPVLLSGRTYFVAAGGPRSIYRIVFALPVDALEAIRGGPVAPVPASQPSSQPNTQ